MANEKILNTRIILKNDTLAAFNDSTFIPKKGEMLLASIDAVQHNGQVVPTYLIKVGDGKHKFSELTYAAAQAADVYAEAVDGGYKFYTTVDGTKTYVPSVDIPRSLIKGSVGAGDAFCAGMLYSLYKEFDPEYSLRVAGAAAGCNLTEKNSIDGEDDNSVAGHYGGDYFIMKDLMQEKLLNR